MSTAAPSRAAVTIRRAEPDDAPACGQICYDAFHTISTRHNFPPDVPEPAIGIRMLTQIFSHPGFYCVVAEVDGCIAGSNCLDERDAIAGVGPITIDPKVQNRGVGRKLMDAVLDRALERKFAGVRLVQAAFHNRSLSLYTTLGFDVREPLSVMQGPAIKKTYEGFAVRKARAADIEACNQLALRVHGHHRGGELGDAVQQGTATVVGRHGRITGYASSLAFSGHAVAETNPDLQAIIAAADSFGGPGILVPSRNAELFRWCLGNGLRVVQPMTLMSLGLYNEPQGAFLPSILY
jgi:GNAT superfamily N-acetyltransferase